MSQVEPSKTQAPEGVGVKVPLIQEIDDIDLVNKLFDIISEENYLPILSIEMTDEKQEELTRYEWWEKMDYYIVKYNGKHYLVFGVESGFEKWYGGTLVVRNMTGYETYGAYLVEGDIKEALKKKAVETWELYNSDQIVNDDKVKHYVRPASIEELEKELDKVRIEE